MTGRRAALLTALLLAATPAQAGAAFWAVLATGGGIGAAFGATVVGGWLTGTFIGRLLVSVVLSALQAKLQKRKAPRTPGIRTKVAGTGGTQPRAFIVGRYATAGGKMAPEMSHGAVDGYPNYYLTQTVDVCDIPGATVARIAIDGEWAPLGTTPHPDFGLPVEGKWTGQAWLKLRTGLETTADAHLLAAYGSYPERPWSADMIGRGMVHAILTFGYSAEVFNGIPRVLFEVVGLPLYDARADGTAGGSGPQRWADPATWGPSENPMVIVENILRGITLPDLGTWGGRIPGADLRRASFTAAADYCDVPVALAAGGTEPRYRAGFEIKVSDEPHEVLDEILKSCNGELAEAGGTWIAKAGPPGLPVYFFTDGDLLTDRPEDMDPLPGGDGTINAVTPTFVAPEMIWAGKEGPMFTDPAWEAADGDRREVDLPLNAVASPAQAQRIAAAYARDARRWRAHKLPLPPDAAVLEPLDVVAWTSARNGYVAKHFEVREIEDDPETMVQIVTLREVDPADYSWSTAEEKPVSLPSRSFVEPEVVGLKDWSVTAVSLPDQNGAPRRSGLVLAWDGAATTGAALVEYQIRVAGPGPLVASGTLRADGGTGRVDGLLPATSYDVRARVVTARPANWTAWTAVTTGADTLTQDDLSDGAVSRSRVADPGPFTPVSTTAWTVICGPITGLADVFRPLVAAPNGRAANPLRAEVCSTCNGATGRVAFVVVECRQGSTSIWVPIGQQRFVAGLGVNQSISFSFLTDGLAPFPLVDGFTECRVVARLDTSGSAINFSNTSLLIEQVNK